MNGSQVRTTFSPPLAGGSFDRVRAMVADQSQMVRQGVRMALHQMGMREVADAATLSAAVQSVRDLELDLLIINRDIEGNDASAIIRELRAGRMGGDPFVVVVLLLTQPDEARVRHAIDSGSDDILLVPFTAEQLMTRINGILSNRKRFVVTHDYIGPDRRKAPRPGAASATTFDVPNPLRARYLGSPTEHYYRTMRDSSRDALARERIRRLAAHIEWEARRALTAAREGSLNADEIIAGMFRLELVVEELRERIEGGNAAIDFRPLLERSRAVKDAPRATSVTEYDRLFNLAREIAGSVAIAVDSVSMMTAIRR